VTQTISNFVFSSALATGAEASSASMRMMTANAEPAAFSMAEADPSFETTSDMLLAAPATAVVAIPPATHGITGQQINLTSRHGQIGSATQAVRVQAGQTLFDHGVQLKAHSHVSVVQPSGHLLVQSAVSDEGDVALAAPQGSILSSHSRIQRDTRPQDVQQAAWDRLGLSGQKALDRALHTVQSLYQVYWKQYRGISLQGGQYVAGPRLGADWQFVYSDAEHHDLLARGVTHAQLAQIEERQTREGLLLEAAFGDQPYQPDYVATADNAPASLLKITEWDLGALQSAPARAAFAGTPDANTEGAPTIVGRNVNLQAGMDVGTPSQPRVITLGAGSLADEELSALANAEPGTITHSGNQLTVDGAHPLRIAASGQISAQAPGNLSTFPPNSGPTAVELQPVVQQIPEKTLLDTRLLVANIVVTDDFLGDNQISLDGPDAWQFEVLGRQLFLREGISLDHHQQSTLQVTVIVGDRFQPNTDPVSVDFSLDITNVAPSVTTVSVPAGFFRPGQIIPMTVTFDEPVVVSGDLRLPVQVGTLSRWARYESGSGTAVLVFAYTVASNDLDGAAVSLGQSLVMKPGTVADQDGLAGDGALPVIDTSLTRIDTVAPRLLSVAAPPAGVYAVGSQLRFAVRFSEPMLATGTPFLALTGIRGGTLGTTPRQAVVVDGVGTDTLIFAYTVAAGERATNVTLVPVRGRRPTQVAIQLPGASQLTDRAGQLPTTLVATAPRMVRVQVDALIPRALTIIGPAARVYGTGSVLEFSLVWNRAVSVTGTPRLDVTIGTEHRQAAYVSGSGTTRLRFRLTVQAGESGRVAMGTQLMLPEGARVEAVGNPASLELPAWGNRNVLADAITPVAQTLTLPAAELFIPGQRLRVVVEYSKPVLVSRAPWIDVRLGNQDRQLVYVAGSGTRRLVFEYQVTLQDVGLRGLQLVSPIQIGRGKVFDLARNPAALVLPKTEILDLWVSRRR
jgi:hypothetical protein